MTTQLPRVSSNCLSEKESNAVCTQHGMRPERMCLYIEMFYNVKRRHNHADRLSPVNYEKQYFERLASV